MITCWDKKVSARLQIESVIQCLTKAARVWVADVPVFLLASEAGIAQVMGLKGEEAQNFVDKLYKVASSDFEHPLSVLTPRHRLWLRPRSIHHLGRHTWLV